MKLSKKVVAMLLTGAMLVSAVGLTACGAGSEPVDNTGDQTVVSTVTDNQDAAAPVTVDAYVNGEVVQLTYEKTPERVVSYAGFATEILLALGVGDNIAGYAYQDNAVLPQYEQQFSTLKALADDPYTEPSAEITLAAEPDFFISWTGSNTYTYEWCQKNNIMTYGLHCEKVGATIEDTYTDILNLGKIFKVEDRANQLVNEMKTNIASVNDRVKDKTPVSVFVCDVDSGDQAFTAGGGLVADIIEQAGGQNIITDTDKNWTRVSWEVVADANPDWIVIDYYEGFDDIDGVKQMLKTNPATAELDAVKNDKFIVVGLTDISAGERIDDTVKLLADQFHPEEN